MDGWMDDERAARQVEPVPQASLPVIFVARASRRIALPVVTQRQSKVVCPAPAVQRKDTSELASRRWA